MGLGFLAVVIFSLSTHNALHLHYLEQHGSLTGCYFKPLNMSLHSSYSSNRPPLASSTVGLFCSHLYHTSSACFLTTFHKAFRICDCAQIWSCAAHIKVSQGTNYWQVCTSPQQTGKSWTVFLSCLNFKFFFRLCGQHNRLTTKLQPITWQLILFLENINDITILSNNNIYCFFLSSKNLLSNNYFNLHQLILFLWNIHGSTILHYTYLYCFS